MAKATFAVSNAADVFSQGERNSKSLFERVTCCADIFESYVSRTGRGYDKFLHLSYLDQSASVCYYENGTFKLCIRVETETPDLLEFVGQVELGMFGVEATSNRTYMGGGECVVCMDGEQTSGFTHEGE